MCIFFILLFEKIVDDQLIPRILLQPPPPVNDTNPYNVFRPREKAHRLHTRRVGATSYVQ